MKTYKFRSLSKPDSDPHIATQDDDGFIQCSCLGYKWRNVCKHVKAIEAGTVKPEPGECVEPEGGGDISFNTEAFDSERTTPSEDA